jgi:hypothetical protein
MTNSLYNSSYKLTMLPNPNYMDQQPELRWEMRAALVDWLMDTHSHFRLLPETLFLGINIMDRFLSCRVISVGKLQLVGITCLWIAAKYEEIMVPSVHNFTYITNGLITASSVVVAERYILQTIGFDLSYPNPLNFLRRCSKADNYNAHSRTLAKYFMEISLVNHRLMKFPPSCIAAASLLLARRMLDNHEWVSIYRQLRHKSTLYR